MKTLLTLIVSLSLAATAGTALADGAWQLTFDPAEDGSPAWSPDGSLIAFASYRSGNWDIWVIPARGISQNLTDRLPAAGGLRSHRRHHPRGFLNPLYNTTA